MIREEKKTTSSGELIVVQSVLRTRCYETIRYP